jgi:hypothetical protein
MKLILAPFGRCATNSISLSVSQSCEESWVGEPFDVNLHNSRYSINDSRSISDSLKSLSSEGVTLIKHLYEVMSRENNKSLVQKCTHIIFMYRKYFVDQYISSFMCEQLAEYRKSLKLKPIKKNDPHFFNLTLNHLLGREIDRRYNEYLSIKRDPIDIDHLKEKYETRLNYFNECKDIFSELDKSPAVYSYENLWENTPSVFKDICSNLGCKIKNDRWKLILSKKNKMFKDSCKDLIPNYKKVISLREELTIQ